MQTLPAPLPGIGHHATRCAAHSARTAPATLAARPARASLKSPMWLMSPLWLMSLKCLMSLKWLLSLMALTSRTVRAALVVMSASLALTSAAGAAAAGVPPDDAAELVETLLGLEPSRHATPLAAMKGWGELYDRYHRGARDGNPTAMRVWLLLGYTAAAKADAATSEALSEDLLPVFQAQPDALLAALADNAWLVPVTCFYLGKHFDFQGRAGAGRNAFVQAQAPLITRSLPAPSAARCLAQLKAPRHPLR
jgi:hypothetical protein